MAWSVVGLCLTPNRMKFAIIALFSALTCIPLIAASEGWTADFTAAKTEAAAAKQDLLLDFTGSDWCGACIALHKEVFSTQAFKDGVKDKFILVELDYPNDKSKLSEEAQNQNQDLAKKYSVEAFPTIFLCDASGKPYAVTGYQEGGPVSYVKHLDALRAKKILADETLKSASNSEGVAKAKLLAGMLRDMDLSKSVVDTFYSDVVAQIKASDPNDESGFLKVSLLKDKLAKFQKELSFFAQGDDFPGALKLVDETIKDGGFDKPEVQQMMATRGVILAQLKKFDEAMQAVDEAKAFAPDSELAAGLDEFRKKLQSAKEANAASEPKAE